MDIVDSPTREPRPIPCRELREAVRNLTGPVYATKRWNPEKKEFDCPRKYTNKRYARKVNELRSVFLTEYQIPYEKFDAGPDLKVCATPHKPKTLLYLDADTHDSGTAEAVRELFRRVRVFFPHMPEPVVTDRGGSAWLVVQTHVRRGNTWVPVVDEKEYNRLVLQVQDWLRELATGLDIQFVEVKGKVYQPEMDGSRVVKVKAGDLMKCPPGMEWVTQPPVTVEELNKLQPSEEFLRAKAEKRKPHAGSRVWFSDEDREKVSSMAGVLKSQGIDGIRTAGRQVVTALDVAIFCLIVVRLRTSEQPDHSLPRRRIQELWNLLVQQGIVDRGFCCTRYAVIHRLVRERGLLECFDNTYQPGSEDPVTGERTAGRCMRWRAGDSLVEWVEEATEQREQSSVEQPLSSGPAFVGDEEIWHPCCLIRASRPLPDDYEHALDAVFALAG